MSIPFNIKDDYWSEIHPGMSSRIKHRLILVRHGESTSNAELTLTGQTTEYAIDHALTNICKEQAQDVSNFLESKCIFYIYRIEI
jgi:broad specificity phosphatase PhoE